MISFEFHTIFTNHIDLNSLLQILAEFPDPKAKAYRDKSRSV